MFIGIKNNIKEKIAYMRNKQRERYFNKVVNSKLIESEDSISADYEKKIKAYWDKYNIQFDLGYHKWYSSRNGIQDPRYIPESIFYPYIVPYYNNLGLADAFQDKAYYTLLFPDVKMPTTLVKNINGQYFDANFNPITEKTAIDICSKQNKMIIKPTIDSGAGKGLHLINEDNINEVKAKTKKAFNNNPGNFIVQKFITQHSVISELNPTSVNTIRLFSFLDNQEVIILGAHIRTGKKDSFHDHFGVVYGIDKEGKLYDFGIKSHDGYKLYRNKMNSNFENIKIPNFDKILSIIENKHEKLAHFRLIAWDFAINYDGEPLFIEINLKSPGINNHQLIDGPLFREYTDKVLNDVFN